MYMINGFKVIRKATDYNKILIKALICVAADGIIVLTLDEHFISLSIPIRSFRSPNVL